MEMVLRNGFCEMEQNEMLEVEGGNAAFDFIGSGVCGFVGGKVGAKIGAAVGGSVGGPVGAVIGGIVGVAAFEVVYHLNN